jgi:hypothetical protein
MSGKNLASAEMPRTYEDSRPAAASVSGWARAIAGHRRCRPGDRCVRCLSGAQNLRHGGTACGERRRRRCVCLDKNGILDGQFVSWSDLRNHPWSFRYSGWAWQRLLEPPGPEDAIRDQGGALWQPRRQPELITSVIAIISLRSRPRAQGCSDRARRRGRPRCGRSCLSEPGDNRRASRTSRDRRAKSRRHLYP